jgi:hypothetical protein
VQKPDPAGDKNSPEDKRSEDPPKEDFVVMNVREFEIVEDKEKNEKIVETQCPFQDIARKELHCELLPPDQINTPIKKERNHGPNYAPNKRFLHFDYMLSAMKNTEIQREHNNDYHAKNRPGKKTRHCYVPFFEVRGSKRGLI